MKTILDWIKNNHAVVVNINLIYAAIGMALMHKESWYAAGLQIAATLYPSFVSSLGVKVPPVQPPTTGV